MKTVNESAPPTFNPSFNLHLPALPGNADVLFGKPMRHH